MSGGRLLDVLALVGICRTVAYKHMILQSRRLNDYNNTSSLTHAVRYQTSQVTDTIKAASALAARLNEEQPRGRAEPQPGTTSASTDTPRHDDLIPQRQAAESVADKDLRVRLNQDHFGERPSEIAVTSNPTTNNLPIKQETAERYSLPDGTIPTGPAIGILAEKPRRGEERNRAPVVSGTGTSSLANSRKSAHQQSEDQIPSKTAEHSVQNTESPLRYGLDQDVFYGASTSTSSDVSSIPRVKIPTYPSAVQESDESIGGGQINSDSFYDSGRQNQQQFQANVKQDIEEVNSQRVASALKEKHNLTLGPTTSVGEIRDSPQIFDRQLTSATNGKEAWEVRDVSQQDPQVEAEPVQRVPPILSPDHFEHDISKAPLKTPSATPSVGTFSTPSKAYELRESTVPSSRFSRLWNYGGLAAGMFGGAIGEGFRRIGGAGGSGSYALSAGNMDRLVTKLSRMRGAALKLGQMISFQDSKMLPLPIQEVLQRVQDRADYMPSYQRDEVLVGNLGSNWRDLYSSFDEKPLAAASIGQVHNAVLKSNGVRVAVKIQYPGVADSIDSDLSNLTLLLTASRLLPKGLYLDKTIQNARTELAWECDYLREADCGRRFRQLLADEQDVFVVPKVFSEASGRQVLTMEFMEGIGVTRIQNFSQEQKDWIGTQILRLCLREITEFRFMQTDPNWTNFLYNSANNKLELLDFGASREYPEVFITKYASLLAAASRSDRDRVKSLSINLGYLTGSESKTMLDAHIASVMTLAEPFLASSPEIYDFKDQTITERVKAYIPIMIRERLAPPPEETYSLHRKLSGAFLLCARLGSRVRCRELFDSSMAKFRESPLDNRTSV